MFFLKPPSLSISLRTLHAVGVTPPTLSLTNSSIHNFHDFIFLPSYIFLLNVNTSGDATEPRAIYCYEGRHVTAQCQVQITADCLCLRLYECRVQRGIQTHTFLPASLFIIVKAAYSSLLPPLEAPCLLYISFRIKVLCKIFG